MKANKAKSKKKTTAKATKRSAKKELEASISNKFMEVVSNLGQDAGKFAKDIKKASKQLASKVADKWKNVKENVEDRFETSSMAGGKSLKKPVSISRVPSSKSVSKAEKVVAKVTKANAEVKPKRTYNRRPVSSVPEQVPTAKTSRKPVASKAGVSKQAKPAAPQRAARVKPAAVTIAPPASSVQVENNSQGQEEKNNTI